MKFIKASFVLVACGSLIACAPSANKLNFSVLPQELQDCKIFRISDNSESIVIARCPNSSTSVHWSAGKSSYNTVTVENMAE